MPARIDRVGAAYGRVSGGGGSPWWYKTDFPYKPETLFIFPWWTAPVGIGVAVIFCIIGAYFPGREAAKQEPAEALTQ